MELKIEQIAFHVADVRTTVEAYRELGFDSWVFDTVEASGIIRGRDGSNVAELAFNYDIIPGKELELICYKKGPNWLADHKAFNLSHMGMHCDADQMFKIRKELDGMRAYPIQEVWTTAHTNPAIRTSRRYHYLIFDSRKLLGFDLKLIRRIPCEG
jgi:hypothetical protein